MGDIEAALTDCVQLRQQAPPRAGVGLRRLIVLGWVAVMLMFAGAWGVRSWQDEQLREGYVARLRAQPGIWRRRHCKKRFCMLGGFSVGETSLVKRFVQRVFSEAYLTTVGVKIDGKTVDLAARCVSLILWDLAGEDDLASLRMSCVRCAAGYVLVADGSLRTTLDVAASLRQRVEADSGPMPFVLLLLENDLKGGGEIPDPELAGLRDGGWWVRTTSARTGEGVEDAFMDLAVRVSR